MRRFKPYECAGSVQWVSLTLTKLLPLKSPFKGPQFQLVHWKWWSGAHLPFRCGHQDSSKTGIHLPHWMASHPRI